MIHPYAGFKATTSGYSTVPHNPADKHPDNRSTDAARPCPLVAPAKPSILAPIVPPMHAPKSANDADTVVEIAATEPLLADSSHDQ